MLTEKRFSIWGLMLAFVVLVGPFALSFHMHYPDEMYYSDAAVRMLQTGDIQTPYLGSEELRFKKPILTYWFVLAGFKLFGVTPFASRIFFLLAGAATVGFVYWGARVLFDDRRVASLSAIIMASQPVLILSATRSIPDVLLGMCMAISTVGFLGFIKHGDQAPKRFHWLLFVGIALAFEVKGLPAAALGGLGMGYLLLNPWQRISTSKLFYLPAVLTGLVIACYWFVAMYWVHGPMYLESFIEDQVGIRVGNRFLLLVKNFVLAAVLLIVLFIPWFIFGLKKIKTQSKKLFLQNSAFVGLVVLWVLAIVLMSAGVTKFYERYLLPVLPLASIWLGWLLIENGALKWTKSLKFALLFFLTLNLFVLLIGIYFNTFLESSFWVWGQCLFVFLFLFYLYLKRNHSEGLPQLIAWSVLLLFFGASISTYQISLPDAGQLVKEYVADKQIPEGSKIAFIGHLHTGSKIRIGLGAQFYMIDLNPDDFIDQLGQYDFILVEDKYLELMPQEKFSFDAAAINWDAKFIKEMAQSLWVNNSQEVKEATGKKYYWGTPF